MKERTADTAALNASFGHTANGKKLAMNLAKIVFAIALIGLSAIATTIYSHQRREATQITLLLKPYEATVEQINSCGRGDCYISILSLNVSGQKVPSRAQGKLGYVGSTVTVWSKPNYLFSYTHRTQLEEQASRSWLLAVVLIPNIFVFSMLIWSKPAKKAAAFIQNAESSAHG